MSRSLPIIVTNYRPRSVAPAPFDMPERGKMYYRYSNVRRWNKIADRVALVVFSIVIVALLWSTAYTGTNGAIYDTALDQIGMLITILQN